MSHSTLFVRIMCIMYVVPVLKAKIVTF